MAKIIIDGEGAIMGRLASYVAKQALSGNEIVILNSEKVLVSGNKADIIAKYKQLRTLGSTAQKGPFYHRKSYMILKRSIRGMLPSHREGIGRTAFKNIKCYDNFPEEFKKEKIIKVKTENPKKFMNLKELMERI